MPVRTEKEKMLAGEIYSCLDPELEIDRQQAKKLMLAFNKSEDEADQQTILRQMFGGIGKNLVIWPPFYCSYGMNTYFGSQVFIIILVSLHTKIIFSLFLGYSLRMFLYINMAFNH